MDRAHQPNRLARQISAVQRSADAARISFVEDQIQRVQHRGETGSRARVSSACETARARP